MKGFTEYSKCAPFACLKAKILFMKVRAQSETMNCSISESHSCKQNLNEKSHLMFYFDICSIPRVS